MLAAAAGTAVLRATADDVVGVEEMGKQQQQPPLLPPPLPTTVVLVVGASGNLARTKTYPALYELWCAGRLPAAAAICGWARTPLTASPPHEEHRDRLRPWLLNTTRTAVASQDDDSPAHEADVDDFLSLCFYYYSSGYGDSQAVIDILTSAVAQEPQHRVHNLLVYLAVPPSVFAVATGAVRAALAAMDAVLSTGFVRLILEKPFGRDTESCRALLDALRQQGWRESDLYRIDHYLGKPAVRGIAALRHRHRANPESLWNKNAVQAVHIVFKESFGADRRGGYFDAYGIIRDVMQNHLLQILTLIAMELPPTTTATTTTTDAVRDAKVRVLKCMPCVRSRDCLLGQYDGYAMDSSIANKGTVTPTYACVRTWVDNRTWHGVPFVLEAGKAVDESACEVRLHLRSNGGGSGSNGDSPVLIVRIQPSPAAAYYSTVSSSGTTTREAAPAAAAPSSAEDNGARHHALAMDDDADDVSGAYAKLILDALRGERAHFVRNDELLEAWRIFTPLLHEHDDLAAAAGAPPPSPSAGERRPASYARGTAGPAGRRDFLRSVGIGASPPLPLSQRSSL